MPKDTANHFASFIDKNNNLRYAYTEEQITETATSSITYTFTTGYDVMPKINGVVYSSKYEDKRNGDGTTTRTLLSDELITQISFNNVTNNKYLLSIDKCSNIKLTTCYYMFNGCSGLKSVNLNGIDTSNVTDIGWMFCGCTNLTELNLSNFDTSNATDMRSVFYNCRELTELNLSNFDTSNATDISYMFYSCTKLTSLDIRNFSSINLKSSNRMFYYVNSSCKVYVNKSKFTNTESQCNFSGSFTYI